MIQIRTGDIFAQKDLTHIVHQANLFNVFGAGIAKEIKARYPEAFNADAVAMGQVERARDRLGYFSRATGKDGVVVVNLYSQVGIGPSERQTSYDAMVTGFERLYGLLMAEMHPVVLGIPYKIGCGLANGDWTIVEAIIRAVFNKAPFRVVVCMRQGD